MAKLKLKKKFKVVKRINNENQIDIFKMGSLLQFETKAWQAGKKITDKSFTKLTAEEAEWINTTKILIDKKHLRGINVVIQRARSIVEQYSLPFPIKGVHFIPSEKIEELTEKMMEFQDDLNQQVNLFLDDYENYITEAETNLGDNLFNIYDYPNKEELRSRFGIQFRFFEFVVPSNLSEEIKEEETKKYKEMIEEARKQSMLALKKGFKEIIDNLVKKMTEKLKGEEDVRLQDRSIEKINEFFEIFKYKNIFQDNELEKQIIEAKNIINGIDIKALKDESLMKEVNENLSEVNKALESQIKFMTSVKRKLRL